MIHPDIPSDFATGRRAGGGESTTQVRYLESRLDRLEMICEAMFNLLKEHMQVEDADLMACIAELDLSDGAADGKVARGPQRCGKCNRPNSRRHDFCIYCGQMMRVSPF